MTRSAALRRLTPALGMLVAFAVPTAAAQSLDTRVGAETSVYADDNAVTVVTPGADVTIENRSAGWSANGHYLVDVVSAASVDIVSTASPRWSEVRHEGGLGFTYQRATTAIGVTTSVSSEPDYLSLSAGGTVQLELVDKNVNPLFGYVFTHDTAGRVGTPFSIFSQKLARHTGTAGVELVVDRASTAYFALDVMFEHGNQAKPYRFLPVFAPEVAPQIQPGAPLATVNELRLPGRLAENLPGERWRFALSGRFARRFTRSTLVLLQRVYGDDWGLVATTSDARFSADAGARLVLSAGLRAHVQSGVYFWERAYTARLSGADLLTVPKYRTGDRELGPLLTATLGAGARYGFGSAARPQAFALALQADEMATTFRDTLYFEQRWAHLLTLQVEAEL